MKDKQNADTNVRSLKGDKQSAHKLEQRTEPSLGQQMFIPDGLDGHTRGLLEWALPTWTSQDFVNVKRGSEKSGSTMQGVKP